MKISSNKSKEINQNQQHKMNNHCRQGEKQDIARKSRSVVPRIRQVKRNNSNEKKIVWSVVPTCSFTYDLMSFFFPFFFQDKYIKIQAAHLELASVSNSLEVNVR